jgi:hypothetical protein
MKRIKIIKSVEKPGIFNEQVVKVVVQSRMFGAAAYIGVETDKHFGGHDCERNGRDGHCWFLRVGTFTFIDMTNEWGGGEKIKRLEVV